MVHDTNTHTWPNMYRWQHVWPVSVFSRASWRYVLPSHSSLAVTCSRPCLSCKTITPKQTHIDFNSSFSFISCPITSEKSDFAPFVSNKATPVMTDKALGVSTIILHPSKRKPWVTWPNCVYKSIVVSPSSPLKGPKIFAASRGGSPLSPGEASLS